jgi:hypothetical protein
MLLGLISFALALFSTFLGRLRGGIVRALNEPRAMRRCELLRVAVSQHGGFHAQIPVGKSFHKKRQRSVCAKRCLAVFGSINFEPFGVHAQDLRSARARKQGPVPSMLLKSAKNISLALALTFPAFPQGLIQMYQVITPTSSTFNNINPRYNAWTVMYNYSGGGTFSIELDCAEDATVAGGTPTPGSFSACTATTGSNPSTTPNYGYITFVGYTPWLKLNLTALSLGNMTAVAMGFQAADPESGGGGSGGCVGTATTPCVVDGPNSPGSASTKNPVQVAGNDGTNVQFISTDTSGRSKVVGAAAVGASPSGNPVPTAVLDGAGKVITPTYPNLNVAVSLSSSGLTQLIALSGSTVIRVEHVSVSFQSAVNFQLEYGTGSNCGTGTTALTGVYESVVGVALDFDLGTLNIPSGNALCANLGASVTGGGLIVYAQY